MQQRIAIIGAGMSGLACAKALADHGRDVVIYEKSRGVGGRMATRRTIEGFRFDHGAQYFTVRDERFATEVTQWEKLGHAALWPGIIGTLHSGTLEPTEESKRRYVGVPSMNSVCKYLAKDLDVRLRTRVQPPKFTGSQWNLQSESGDDLGKFDALVVSAPAAQTAELLADAPEIGNAAGDVKLAGCWALMLAFERRLPLVFDGAFVEASPLSWISRNNSKANRESTEAWVLHASADWSEKHIDLSPEDVALKLIKAFWDATGVKPTEPKFLAAHRWRYAIPVEPSESRCLEARDKKAIACGDWCTGPRVEGAFLSGLAAAERLSSWLS